MFSKKTWIGIFILSLFALTTKAQDTLTTYYNSDWDKIKKKHKSEADHYRHSYINSDGIPVFECFYMTGELKAEGSYSSKKYKVFDGLFTSYNKNGAKKSYGHFDKDNRIGKWSFWFDSGILQSVLDYNLQGEKHGLFQSWYEDSTLDCTGEFLNDKEVGDWLYYFRNGKIASLETYDFGDLKGFKFWDELGNSLNIKNREIYEHINYVQKGKGDNALSNYILNNFIYPPKARAVGIEGRVILNFKITEMGELKDLKMTGSKNKSFRAEAERLINGYNNWFPAKHHNRKIQSTYTLPIVFNLR